MRRWATLDGAAPRIIAVSGYNGRGIAPGTAFGQVLARYILGTLAENDLPLPVTPAESRTARQVREAGIEWGAQAVHIIQTIV